MTQHGRKGGGSTAVNLVKIVSPSQRFLGAWSAHKVELLHCHATKTIPAYLEETPQLIVSLLYLDFDIYEPTVAAPKGAVIAFGELNLKDWRGESIAVLESLKLRDYRIDRCSFGSVNIV